MLKRVSARGFSLIELLVALAVFGILILAAMPSYSSWLQSTKVRNTAESMLSGLQLARSEALRRNTSVEFAIGANSDWTVAVATPPETIQTRPSGQGSHGTAVTVTPAAATRVTFNSLGRIVPNANGSAPFTQLDFDVPDSDARVLRLVLGTGGRARMCDPAVGDAADPRYCIGEQ